MARDVRCKALRYPRILQQRHQGFAQAVKDMVGAIVLLRPQVQPIKPDAEHGLLDQCIGVLIDLGSRASLNAVACHPVLH